jgi:hypothetical protein
MTGATLFLTAKAARFVIMATAFGNRVAMFTWI